MVRDPLAADEIAQHRDVRGDGPPVQGAEHVREVKVIAEKVDALADGLEGGGDVVKVEVDEVVEGLFGAGVEGGIVVGAGD